MKVSATNSSGATIAALTVGKATRPTITSTTNITTGPIRADIQGCRQRTDPAGLGIPASAQMMPVAMPTATLITVTVSR